MKALQQSINKCRLRLSSNDKRNFEAIADELEKITNQISDQIEVDEENENSDTAALARTLSSLAAQLRGEWEDEVVFDFNQSLYYTAKGTYLSPFLSIISIDLFLIRIY